MEDANAAAALASFTGKLKAISAALRQSLTYDQEKEMLRHVELMASNGVRVCFASRSVLETTVPMRTPTACCASICLRERTCRPVARNRSAPLFKAGKCYKGATGIIDILNRLRAGGTYVRQSVSDPWLNLPAPRPESPG